MMTQALAGAILETGQSALLTGPAGSGKTYVLNEFIRRAKSAGRHVAVTATTGLAATHLNGSTIHSWSGIGIHDQLHPKFHESLSESRQSTIRKADVLVIDEISMLHDFRLDLIDQLTRQIRQRSEPFGGLQVVLCGDFFQLPPVNRTDARSGGFVTNSLAWQELNPVICYLNEQHRQDDQSFLMILNALRTARVDDEHVTALRGRFGAHLEANGTVTQLHTTNVDVERINQAELAKVSGTEHQYQMSNTGKSSYVDSLKRSCLAPETLTLKIGALVMAIRNDPDRQFANGSLGTVTGFDSDTNAPIVQFRNGRTVLMEPATWELRDGDTKRAALTQLPLRLAWAITVHKSQGMTLDAARIDLGRAFTPGMGYVALSRVRRLEDLSLSGLNRIALTVSDEARAIDEQLRQKSDEAVDRFKHLLESDKFDRSAKVNAGSDDKDDRSAKTVTNWSERLEQMRRTYPNAYRPWSEKDDAKLKFQFAAGAGLKELTKDFGRHPGSIRSRLKIHFGDKITVSK